MRALTGLAVNHSKRTFVLVAAMVAASCGDKPNLPPVVKADKPFAAGGSLEMQLDAGNYTIRAGSDDHIRVTFAGNIGNATADLATTGATATLAVKDGPRENFQATIDVPSACGLTIHLTAGNLRLDPVTGNKDIDSTAGNVAISIPNANDYATVQAAVNVGNLQAGPFGQSGSGLSPSLKWSGPGKYSLKATLGSGNLELKPLPAPTREGLGGGRGRSGWMA